MQKTWVNAVYFLVLGVAFAFTLLEAKFGQSNPQGIMLEIFAFMHLRFLVGTGLAILMLVHGILAIGDSNTEKAKWLFIGAFIAILLSSIPTFDFFSALSALGG